MYCEFCICIYNDDMKCTVEEVEIDGSGSCMSCIIPNIPERIIEKYKQETIKKLDEEDR